MENCNFQGLKFIAQSTITFMHHAQQRGNTCGFLSDYQSNFVQHYFSATALPTIRLGIFLF